MLFLKKKSMYTELLSCINGSEREFKLYSFSLDKDFIKAYNYWKENQDDSLNEEEEEKFIKICNLVDLYFSYYGAVRNLKKILNNTNKYTLEQRRETVKTIHTSYDEIKKGWVSLDSLAKVISLILKRTYIDAYNELRKEHGSTLNKEDYLKSKELVEKIYNYHIENCYNHYHDVYNTVTMSNFIKNENISKEEFKHALETVKESFNISLINDDSIKVYEDFPVDDLYKMIDLMKKIYKMAYNEAYNKGVKKTIFLVSDEEINKIFLLIKKYISQNNNNYEILYNLIKNDNYNTKQLKDYLDSYKLYIEKNVTNEEEQEKYIKIFSSVVELANNFTNGTKGIFDLIVSNNSKEQHNKEISMYLLYENGFSPITIKRRMLDTMLYFKVNEEAKEFYSEFKEYYKKRKEMEKNEELAIKEEEEKNNVQKYEKVIKEFINSGVNSIKEWCNKNKIEENEFRYMIEILKKFESPVYTIYEKYIDSQKSQRFAIIVSKLNKMFEEMVKSNGKFTLLDYYEHTRLSLDETIKIMKDNITPSQRTIWAKFAIKYKNDKELDQYKIKQLLEDSNKIKYCIEMDNKGNVLNSYEVTRADKEQALLMLKEKKMPITNATFSLMVKKYYEESILPSLTNNKGKTI